MINYEEMKQQGYLTRIGYPCEYKGQSIHGNEPLEMAVCIYLLKKLRQHTIAKNLLLGARLPTKDTEYRRNINVSQFLQDSDSHDNWVGWVLIDLFKFQISGGERQPLPKPLDTDMYDTARMLNAYTDRGRMGPKHRFLRKIIKGSRFSRADSFMFFMSCVKTFLVGNHSSKRLCWLIVENCKDYSISAYFAWRLMLVVYKKKYGKSNYIKGLLMSFYGDVENLAILLSGSLTEKQINDDSV